MKMIPFLIFLLTLASCQKTYDLEACNDLSMKKFKGFTDAKKKFADNCTSFNIKYTQEVCQAALNELILKNNLKDIKQKYGYPIETCFNEQDIKKYDRSK